MEMPKDYEQTEAFTGEYEQIKLGGHICKIKDAKIEKSKNNKDMLVVEFDIAEGENKDYYQRRFDADTRKDKKWTGTHRIMVLDNEGHCNKFFKGFTTSVEESNANYKFTGDEKSLKDKLFGAVFGQEEYLNVYGEKKMTTKIRNIRSTKNINDAKIPEPKMLPQQGEAFEDFARNNGINVNVDNGDDLPF